MTYTTYVSRSPSLIILDNIDALCPRRDKANNEVERRVVNTLITLIDDLVCAQDLIVSNTVVVIQEADIA